MKKEIKLYRHHTPEFQKQIENSKVFIIDKSRKFNFNNKNKANFYFYSTTIKGAKNYQKKNTKLYRYKSNLNLLDLRKIVNRKKLKNTIRDWIDASIKIKKIMLKNHGAKFVEQHYKEPTKENIYKNDFVFSGLTYWGQNVTDYERGVILKKEIKNLGYDGVIIQDGNSIEVALIKPAKQI